MSQPFITESNNYDTSNIMYLDMFVRSEENKNATLRCKVEKDFPHAIERINKNDITVYERHFNEMFLFIRKIEFKESRFGEQMILHTSNELGDEKAIININLNSKFFKSIAEKLPFVRFSEGMGFSPYDFDDKETGKSRTGVTIIQNGEKLKNYFEGKAGDKLKRPIVEDYAPNKTVAEWRIYFSVYAQFLAKFTQDVIVPKLVQSETKPNKPPTPEHQAGPLPSHKDIEVPDDDLPF